MIILLFSSLSQLVFSFCDKLFGLMVKDIEAMDASILKGEPASGKKQKVPDHMPRLMCFEIYPHNQQNTKFTVSPFTSLSQMGLF